MKSLFVVIAAAACTNTSSDTRISKLEAKVDKITAALDQSLGPAKPDPAQTYAIPVSDDDPVEGPRDAKITIVEGFDFLCPYCFLADPLVEQVRAKYGDDVRVVAKYIVVHGAPAVTAGTYACSAAKQGKYAEMRKAIWNHLFTLDNGQPRQHTDEVAKLDEVASSVGVDPGKVSSDAEACKAWIAHSQRELADFGVHATPAFFINGRPLAERSMQGFDKLIAEEMAKVDHSSVARADYYQKEVVGKGLRHVKSRFD